MLLTFDDVLDRETVNRFRTELARARWVDGRASAGTLSVSVKANQQVDVTDGIGLRLGNEILQRLGNHAGFLSAALPEQILPPKFNRHADGGHYGSHVDGAIMVVPQTRRSLRTDLSATLFLSDPEDYEGGELLIETPFGAQSVKLPAGSLVLYPSTSLHQVTPVTRGARIGAFFWIQSLVRDEGERALLHDLDQAIQRIAPQFPEGHGDLLALTGIYHNLLRRWAVP